MEMKLYKVHTITGHAVIEHEIESYSPHSAIAIADKKYSGINIITKTGELNSATLINILNARAMRIKKLEKK